MVSVGKNVEKRKLLCTADEKTNWCSHYEKAYGVSLRNGKCLWFSNSTFGYLSKESNSTNSERYVHLHVHCSITYNSQSIEKCKWMDKENVIHTYIHAYTQAYHSATRKEGNLATVNNMHEPWGHCARFEVSQIENDKYYITSFICGIGK